MKDRAIRVSTLHHLGMKSQVYHDSEPPCCVASLILLFFVLNSKIPTKNSPKCFFVICWCVDVLLDLIRGFAWFQVDLASPQFSPPSILEIARISTTKSSFSAPRPIPDPDLAIFPTPAVLPPTRAELPLKNQPVLPLSSPGGTIAP